MDETFVLECKNLVCGYPDTPVLSDVNLAVRPREIVAILGGSGSGKSTLVKTILGILRPLAGEIRLLDRDMSRLSSVDELQLMARIGMLFQRDALFGSLTLEENLMLPGLESTELPQEVVAELARAKLALVQLEEFKDRLPDQISGGQRKRAGLARSVMLDPEIVFCDEPTSGLDPVVASSIDQTLLELRRVLGTTFVIITHDIETVRTVADRSLMLSEGRIFASGTFEELSASTDSDVHRFFHRGRAYPPRVDAREETRCES